MLSAPRDLHDPSEIDDIRFLLASVKNLDTMTYPVLLDEGMGLVDSTAPHI